MKKMALVEPRLLEALQRAATHKPHDETYPVNQPVKALRSLDQEMEAILRRSSLSDTEKLQQYHQTLQRFLTFHQRLRGSTPGSDTTPLGHSPTTMDQHPEHRDDLQRYRGDPLNRLSHRATTADTVTLTFNNP